MTNQEIIEEELQIAIEEIRKEINANNKGFKGAQLRTSGKTENSLRSKVSSIKGEIFANEYIYNLVFGRKPQGENSKLIPHDTLKEWVRKKLSVSNDILDSVTWAINKKIQKEGTSIYTNEAKGIDFEDIVLRLYDRVSKRLTNNAMLEIKSLHSEYFPKHRKI